MSNFLKILFIPSLIFTSAFFVNAGILIAHEGEDLDPHDEEILMDLYAPRLTPESPFYFIKRITETVQEFVTRDPEARARLGVRLAAERVAEIRVMLEEKGVEARGLEVAERRLAVHTEKVVKIIDKRKEAGEDVAELAGEIEEKLHEQRTALRVVFEESQEKIVEKRIEIQEKIAQAIGDGDTREELLLNEELKKIELVREKAQERKEAAISVLKSRRAILKNKLDEARARVAEERDRLELELKEKKEEALRIRIEEEDDKLERVRTEFKERTGGSSGDNGVGAGEGDSEIKAEVKKKAPVSSPVKKLQETIQKIIPKTEVGEVEKVEEDKPSTSDESAESEQGAGEEEAKVFEGSPPIIY